MNTDKDMTLHNNIMELQKATIQNFDEKLYDCNSVSNFKSINPITTEFKNIDTELKKDLEKAVSRVTVVNNLSKELNDIDAAIEIEASIYEFTIVYGIVKNIMGQLLSAIYNDKVYEVMSNLSKNSSVNNKYLKKNIINGKINAQQVGFMTPQEMNPDVWEKYIKKQELKEYKKNNMAATNLYKCYKCGERKCQVMQMQTRSADEPMTNFVTCLVCHNNFKR